MFPLQFERHRRVMPDWHPMGLSHQRKHLELKKLLIPTRRSKEYIFFFFFFVSQMWAKRERRNRREKASCSEISLKVFYPKRKREEMGLQENVSTEDTCPQVSTYQVVMVVGWRGNSHDIKSGWDVSSDGELWRSHINARWEMSQLRVGTAAHNSTSQVRPLLPSHLSSLPSNNFWTCDVSETMRHQKTTCEGVGKELHLF